MPVHEKYLEPLTEDVFLHITCKSISHVVLFQTDENKLYFLKQYAKYSLGYVETYSYILMDNHVHWLVKTVDRDSLRKFIETIPFKDRKSHQKKFIASEISFEEALELQFKDFFISYALAYNKLFNRSGALFINPFRRIRVVDEDHFTQIVIYQHANVVRHGVRKDFQSYKWSSYQAMLSDKPTILQREKVLDWFGGKEKFIRLHQDLTEYYYSAPFDVE